MLHVYHCSDNPSSNNFRKNLDSKLALIVSRITSASWVAAINPVIPVHSNVPAINFVMETIVKVTYLEQMWKNVGHMECPTLRQKVDVTILAEKVGPATAKKSQNDYFD